MGSFVDEREAQFEVYLAFMLEPGIRAFEYSETAISPAKVHSGGCPIVLVAQMPSKIALSVRTRKMCFAMPAGDNVAE